MTPTDGPSKNTGDRSSRADKPERSSVWKYERTLRVCMAEYLLILLDYDPNAAQLKEVLARPTGFTKSVEMRLAGDHYRRACRVLRALDAREGEDDTR